MLRELLHSSLSEASRKLCSRAWVVFAEFYQRYQSVQVTLPVRTACVALFISFLCAKGLAPSTINSYLSAIAYVHKIQSHYDPTKSFLIEKLLVAVGLSLIPVHLLISVPFYGSMFMIAFYGFFRLRELPCKRRTQSHVVVQFDQVTFLKQTHRMAAVKIVITRFKHNTCNSDRKRTFLAFCPMQILIDYIKQRGYNHGPLFSFTSGDAVSINLFNTELCRALKFCGLDCSRYKTHSFRIGAACYAAEKRFSDEQIRALSRWSSDAFKIYIHPPSLKAN